MSEPIRGKVTNIIDKYTIAINVGTQHGVRKGMKFEVGVQEIEIRDPDNEETLLGVLRYNKARVEVTQAHEKFSVAESYEKVATRFLPFPTLLTAFTPRLVPKPLPVESSQVTEFKKNVEVGDEVVQILTEDEEDLSEKQKGIEDHD